MNKNFFLQEPLSAVEAPDGAQVAALRAALRTAQEETAFHAKEARKLAAALEQASGELLFQTRQAARRAEELAFANRQLLHEFSRTDAQADELVKANRGLAAALDELARQNHEKEKRASELHIANIELDYQNSEKDKRAEELAAANTELAYQNGEKEKRALELLQANAGLESFAYISSHDLQEPIRKMLLWLDQLSEVKDRLFNDAEKARFERIVRSGRRMRQLIEDLYTYSRISTVGQEMSFHDLETLLAEVTATFSETIAAKGAVVEVAGLCSVFGARSQMRLLLLHLVDNALKFARPGAAPLVRISASVVPASADAELSQDAAYTRLVIEDNGIGFEGPGSDRVFEVFQRLHGQDDYPGTGIGLALVQKIAQAHKGLARARSEAGVGSVFTVYLPLPPATGSYSGRNISSNIA
ncbi:MAG: two-component sensor histidine kinase [Chitinophagaceae bacterium]|nr:MAG: two-component sensor histidine kinase [Chitinophagaceae bacterium]